MSFNAYLGAEPIAQALEAGAQIVIAGRSTDSALVLGPILARYGRELQRQPSKRQQFLDLMAAGDALKILIFYLPILTFLSSFSFSPSCNSLSLSL